MRLFKNFFFKPQIMEEAFWAYFHKLPAEIQVEWFRDGSFIIGKVIAGDKEFMTQGRDAKDFVEMVNDAILTAFEIPEDYLEIVKKARIYKPSLGEINKLNDRNVSHSRIGLVRQEESLQLA